MRERKLYEFTPDYAVVPGETLQETIEYLNMSQAEFAKRLGITEQSLVRIIKGEQVISQDTAQKLELVTGTSCEFWMNLETQYQRQKQLIKDQKNAEVLKDWLKQFPVKEMVKREIIKPFTDVVLQAREMMGLLRISSIETFDGAVERMAALARGSAAYSTNPVMAFTYVAIGQKAAEEMVVNPYNMSGFKTLLHSVRAMTKDFPSNISTRLQQMFASVGIALVFVPELKGVHYNGVSKWLSPTKAMIIMNIRGKREDILWFSLFHEAAHILLHSKKQIFISDSNPDDELEQEADKFAANFLIPEEYNARIANVLSQQDIIDIAAELGIAPGIVVGRYHHLTRKWKAYNQLVRKLEWKHDSD